MPKNKSIQYYDNIKIEFVGGNDQEEWYQFIINDFTQYFVGHRHFIDEDGALVEYTFINDTLEFRKETDTIYYWIEDAVVTKMKPIDVVKLALDELII